MLDKEELKEVEEEVQRFLSQSQDMKGILKPVFAKSLDNHAGDRLVKVIWPRVKRLRIVLENLGQKAKDPKETLSYLGFKTTEDQDFAMLLFVTLTVQVYGYEQLILQFASTALSSQRSETKGRTGGGEEDK
jgi:hypothetical protein